MRSSGPSPAPKNAHLPSDSLEAIYARLLQDFAAPSRADELLLKDVAYALHQFESVQCQALAVEAACEQARVQEFLVARLGPATGTRLFQAWRRNTRSAVRKVEHLLATQPPDPAKMLKAFEAAARQKEYFDAKAQFWRLRCMDGLRVLGVWKSFHRRYLTAPSLPRGAVER